MASAGPVPQKNRMQCAKFVVASSSSSREFMGRKACAPALLGAGRERAAGCERRDPTGGAETKSESASFSKSTPMNASTIA